MKVYTKDIKRQAKRSLAWVLETDSILKASASAF